MTGYWTVTQGYTTATGGTTSISFAFTSAATQLPYSWIETWESLKELIWWPDFESTVDLPAYEKSIHGKTRGHLKDPKPHPPRGHKPKIYYNHYHKE